jgi:Contractile injection system tube protein
MSLSQTIIAKRGYLANITTLPPLIYPFQYNPVRLTDSKQVTWGRRVPISPQSKSSGLSGAAASLTGISSGVEQAARKFSHADLHRFESEGDRTLSFQIIVDGRDRRPGEPQRRRNEDGDILADLAILTSFVYPKIGELGELLGAAVGGSTDRFVEQWFNEPPTALLILGDLTVEGFISSLQINETLFNENLNPVRAEIDITMIEKIDSFSFIASSVKRVGRAFYNSASADIGNITL